MGRRAGYGFSFADAGGLGALPFALRSTDSTPAVFTSVANRDTYYTANPGDLQGTPLGAGREAVGIGPTDGSTVGVTAAFIRNSDNTGWVPIATNFVGPTGPTGPTGPPGPTAVPPATIQITGDLLISAPAEVDQHTDRIIRFTGTGGANIDVQDSTLFRDGAFIEGVNSGAGVLNFRALDTGTTPIASANPGDVWRVTHISGTLWVLTSQVLSDASRLAFTRATLVEGHGIDLANVEDTIVIAEQGSGGQIGPRISAFSSTLDTSVDAGDTLSGAVTFTYAVDDAADVDGDLSLLQAGVPLATNISATGTSTTQTINDVTLAGGGSVTFRLQGVDTNANAFGADITVRALLAREYAYAYAQSTSTAGTIDLSSPGVQRFDVTAPSGSYTTSVSVDTGEFFIVEYPDNRQITRITALGQVADLDDFPVQDDVRTIGALSFDARSHENTGPSGTINFTLEY